MNPLSSIRMNIGILSKRAELSGNDQRRLEIASFEIDHATGDLSAHPAAENTKIWAKAPGLAAPLIGGKGSFLP